MRIEMRYFLGIDGGATKTTGILIDENEKIVGKVLGKASNYKVVGLEKAEKNILEIVKKFLKIGNICAACFGLASIDSENDKKIVYNKIKNGNIGKLIKEIIVVNDTEIILPAANLDNGVAVIGGTGSNFLGKNGNRISFAGGLEYILADEGSAFFLGQNVLRSALRSFDGRGEKTILEEMVLKKAKIKNMRNLKDLIYTQNLKNVVASFAPLAEIAAKKGDKIAKKIIRDAIKEYEIGIKAVAKNVGLKGNYKIALVGGVFKSKMIFLGLKQKFGNRLIIVKEPALGAAKIAKNFYFEKYGGKNE
jgi:N-acetylglucosamine kinase-like BadF-type ATPase